MIKKILKGEDVSNVKCKTRLDELLKRLATGESCEDIEGCTDVEKLVKKFNEDFNGGGSGLAGTTWTIDDPYNGVGIEDGVASRTTFKVNFNIKEATAVFGEIIVGYDTTNHSGKFIDYFYDMMGTLNVCPTSPEDGTSGSQWLTQNHRTVTFIDGDDIANPDLLAWLEANATQVK